MADNNQKIIFTTSDNEKIEFTVLEQTTINGTNYILVCDSNDAEESDALILKEIQKKGEDIIYDDVVDDIELQAVAKVFAELMDDIDIQFQ